MKTELTEKNVKYLGRTVLFEDLLVLSLSGSGIEFEYSGKTLDITFIGGTAAAVPDNEANYARIRLYVNGQERNEFLLNRPQMTIHLDKLKRGSVPDFSVIKILKLSECAMSLVGIKSLETEDGSVIKPVSQKPLKIEFIGDSITCGYGVDDPDPLHDFRTGTEDVTKSFSYKTAAALDADYSMFSISGYGIISGYTDNPEVRHSDQLIPDFYRSMGLSYDRLDGIPASQEMVWDFSKYVPDIIVLNLGTNDDSYCQDDASKQALFSQLYEEFLKEIRGLNGKAYIVCAFGLMGDRLYPVIQKTIEEYKQKTGDGRICLVHLPEQDASVGYGANYHPLESEHRKAADVLIPALKQILCENEIIKG